MPSTYSMIGNSSVIVIFFKSDRTKLLRKGWFGMVLQMMRLQVGFASQVRIFIAQYELNILLKLPDVMLCSSRGVL